MVTDSGQTKLMAWCRSNWKMFLQNSGDKFQGYLQWFGEHNTDESAVFESLRRIEKDRMEKKKFSNLDQPSLLEWKYHYRKVMKEREQEEEEEALTTECEFCQSRGRRYLVIHADGGKMNESLITALPPMEEIKAYVYLGTIPCTCSGGRILMRHGASVQKKKQMDPHRWHHVVSTQSHTFTDAQKLMDEYIKHRNVKYHNMTMEEQQPDIELRNQFMRLMQAAAAGVIPLGPPKYERRQEEDIVAETHVVETDDLPF